MMGEQPDANYATVLSRGKDGVVLSLSYRLPSDGTLGGAEEPPLEHCGKHDKHLPTQVGLQQCRQDEYVNDGQVSQHRQGNSRCYEHEEDQQDEENASDAGSHSPPSPMWSGLEINALRPSSSAGAIYLGNSPELDDLQRSRQGLKSRDSVRPVAKTRPASSTPGLGNGSGSSAIMAREVGVVARNQRSGSKARAGKARVRARRSVSLHPPSQE